VKPSRLECHLIITYYLEGILCDCIPMDYFYGWWKERRGAGKTTVYVGEKGVNVNGYGRQTIRKRMDVSCVMVQLETRFGDAPERS